MALEDLLKQYDAQQEAEQDQALERRREVRIGRFRQQFGRSFGAKVCLATTFDMDEHQVAFATVRVDEAGTDTVEVRLSENRTTWRADGKEICGNDGNQAGNVQMLMAYINQRTDQPVPESTPQPVPESTPQPAPEQEPLTEEA